MTAPRPIRLLVASPEHIRIVTYAENDDSSDSRSAQLSTVKTFKVSGDPSWLSFVAPDLVYAIDENSATMRVFKLGPSSSLESDSLEHLTLEEVTQQEGSRGVCHIEFNKDHTRMVAAAYFQGTIDVWDTSSAGLRLMKTITPEGTNGPNPKRQDQSHPHQAVLDPSGRFFIVNDLGTDNIWVIDSKDDAFAIVNSVKVEPAGAGPRHGVFYSANGSNTATHYVLLCEMMNLVILFALEYTDDKLAFTHVQTISTFDPNNPPTTPDAACASELALCGNEIFVSNRITGDPNDNIAHLRLVSAISGSEISVQYVEQVPSGGTWPRMFSTTPDGRALLIGNQKGENGLVALSVGADGKLGAPLAIIPQTVFGPPDAKLGPQYVKEF